MCLCVILIMHKAQTEPGVCFSIFLRMHTILYINKCMGVEQEYAYAVRLRPKSNGKIVNLGQNVHTSSLQGLYVPERLGKRQNLRGITLYTYVHL